MILELVGISNSYNNLILINIVGDILYYCDDLCIEYVLCVNWFIYIEIII